MPLSRLGCPLSLKTPNMGNTGQDSANGARQFQFFYERTDDTGLTAN